MSHADKLRAANDHDINEASLALLCELVAAARHGTRAIEDRIVQAMSAAGCAVRTLDYDPRAVPLIEEFATVGAGSAAVERCLIGSIEGKGRGRSLILFAHPDTEPHCPEPAWRTPPFEPTCDDGRLYGWGVADDLAGMAMLVRSIAILRAAGMRPEGDLHIVSAPSKKHRRGISAALHDGLEADAAIYLHPAESGRGLDEIKAFAPGQLELVITLQGRQPDTTEPAHTAFAHQAVNPFDKAMPIVAALRELDARRGAAVHHPRLEHAIGRSTNLILSHCSFGHAHRLSRIETECRLGAAMTLVPGERLDEAMGTVERTVADAAAADPWLCCHPPKIEWLAGVSAAETADDSDLYQLVSATLTELGATPRVNPLHTSSDIRNPIVQKNIPTVGFGPRCGGLAMSGLADEWVDIADYHRAIQATACIIDAWCGLEPA